MLKDFHISIDAEAMRKCAIDFQWFTCGNNEQYSKWLNMAGWGHKVTPAWLNKVAKVAVEHSNLEKLGYDIEENKDDIIDNFTAILLTYTKVKYSIDYN